MIRTRWAAALSLLVLWGLVLAACANSSQTPGQQLPAAGVVAYADGAPITEAEWQQARAYAEVTRRLLAPPGAQIDERAVLDGYLEDRVIALEAIAAGFTVDAEDVANEEAQILQVAGVDHDKLTAILADVGLSATGWEAELSRGVLASTYLEDIVLADVPPDERGAFRERWLAERKQEHGLQIVKAPPIVEGVRVGDRAPDFTVVTLDGKTLRLSDLRGKPVLLNFWATWCEPCKEELPLLQALHNERGDDIAIVGIDVGENAERVQPFAEQWKLTYPLAIDATQELSRRYLVAALPTSFFIDREGVINSYYLGPIPPDQLDGLLSDLDDPG